MTHFRLNAVAARSKILCLFPNFSAASQPDTSTETRRERSCDEYLSYHLPQNIDYEISIASIQPSRTRHIHWMVSIRIPSLGSRWKLADAYIWKSLQLDYPIKRPSQVCHLGRASSFLVVISKSLRSVWASQSWISDQPIKNALKKK